MAVKKKFLAAIFLFKIKNLTFAVIRYCTDEINLSFKNITKLFKQLRQ